MLESYKLRKMEEEQWDRQKLADTIRATDPSLLNKIDDAIILADQRYASSELDYANAESVPLDDQLRELCQLYYDGTSEVREYIRSNIDRKLGWALIVFSRRIAVIGARTNNPEMIRDGVIAHAVDNLAWGDTRDNIVAFGTLYRSAKRIDADPDSMFEAIAEISGPAISRMLLSFLKRKDKEKV